MNCTTNAWMVDGFALAFQVVFIFAFLTIFFFVYVVKVEKAEFEEQMTFVVDQILTKDIEKKILGPIGSIPKVQLVALVSGLIDGVEFKAAQGSKSAVKSVNDQNDSVRSDAFKTLGIVVGVLIVISVAMLIIGYCLPIRHQVQEALWVVLFVALTEFTFLQVVAKNYRSADPNKVKRTLGAAITRWIKVNKKI